MADQGLASLVTGLAQGIQGYLGQKQKFQAESALEQQKNQLELQRQTALETYKQTLEGKIDPQTASRMHPEAAKLVEDFNTSNGRYPTVDESKTLFQPLDAIKESNHQDMLEKQAMDRLTQVRGDQSLMRAEKQRDAAGMAYDTIVKAQSENRDLSQLEQSDLIGQLWQARTGKAPTDQDMKELQDRTAKRGLNHVITYLTGDPNIVGASTGATMANLKQFVQATGEKADQQWGGYMSARMVKPTGLDEERWKHIASQNRGLSFADQKNTSEKTYRQTDNVAAKKAALRTKLGL